jgi:hypothetical protein
MISVSRKPEERFLDDESLVIRPVRLSPNGE